VSTWEERMAARSRAKGRTWQQQEQQRWEAASQAEDAEFARRHGGHHSHVRGNVVLCSCGEVFGCFSFAPDPRLWSDDPAECAQARREEDDFQAWIICRTCGERGVIAAEDFGTWPPRTISVPA
jgi:hypothetical protein